MYSFDISYYVNEITQKTEIDKTIQNIISKYPNCEWYATDITSFKQNDLTFAINHGYYIYNLNDFKALINDVNQTLNIFIDFICSYPINNDKCLYIYHSINSYNQLINLYKKEYNDLIPNLIGNELEIYKLAKNKINNNL